MADLLSLSLYATLNVLLFHVNPLGIFLLYAKICFSLQHYDLFLFNFDQRFFVGGDSRRRFCDFDVLIYF